MRRKGCTPENQICKRYFSRLKNEMYYYRIWNDITMGEFIDQVVEYIGCYYQKRVKLALGGKARSNVEPVWGWQHSDGFHPVL